MNEVWCDEGGAMVEREPNPAPFMDEIAPGVLGYTVEDDECLWVPAIFATREGSGEVGRYLDSLPTEKTVRVPNVLSPRLAGMLERRGFRTVVEDTGPPFNERVAVYIRGTVS